MSRVVVPGCLRVFGGQDVGRVVLASKETKAGSDCTTMESSCRLMSSTGKSIIILEGRRGGLEGAICGRVLEKVGQLRVPGDGFLVAGSPVRVACGGRNAAVCFTKSSKVSSAGNVVSRSGPVGLIILSRLARFFSSKRKRSRLAGVRTAFIHKGGKKFRVVCLCGPPGGPGTPVGL